MSTPMGYGIPTPNEDDETITVSGEVEIKNDVGNPAPVDDANAQVLLQAITDSLGDTVTVNTVRELLLRIYGAVDDLELSIDNIELSADNIDLDMEEVEALLTTISALDFSTETTLEAARVLIAAIDTTLTTRLDVDLSTRASEVTLAAILTELQLKADKTEAQPIEGGNTADVKVSLGGELVGLDARSDIFHHLITVTPLNQVEMRLDAPDWQTFTDETVASGGSIGQASGLVTLATGTAATGSATLSSTDEVEYRGGVGVFGGGTAVFTAGAADSYQRVGLATDLAFTNGVSFGFEGTTFGIRYTRGGVQQLFVAQADWDEPCLGAAGSAYTRDGVPEALDPTAYGVVYFIQCGLFGFVGWTASVWSPDNGFIPVYTYKHSSPSPVFESNTLKVVLRATKTAGASNLTLSGQCWVAGTYADLRRIGDGTLTERDLAVTVRAVITGETTAGGGGFVNVKVNPSGTLAGDGLTDDELRASPVGVSATDLDIRDLALAQDSVRQTQRPMSSYIASQSSADGTITAATAGASRIRVLRLDGGSKPSNLAGSFCTVTIKLGATNIFVKELQVGEPIGGQVCVEGGIGDNLTVTVTGTGSVQFNLRYEIF